jgi:hypothetical protein
LREQSSGDLRVLFEAKMESASRKVWGKTALEYSIFGSFKLLYMTDNKPGEGDGTFRSESRCALIKVAEVMSNSVYTGLNPYNFTRKKFLQICL